MSEGRLEVVKEAIKAYASSVGMSEEEAMKKYLPAMMDVRKEDFRVLSPGLVEDIEAFSKLRGKIPLQTEQVILALMGNKIQRALLGGREGVSEDPDMVETERTIDRIKRKNIMYEAAFPSTGKMDEKISALADMQGELVGLVKQVLEGPAKKGGEEAKSDIQVLAEALTGKLDATLQEVKAAGEVKEKTRMEQLLEELINSNKAMKETLSGELKGTPPPGFTLKLSDGTVLEGEEAAKHWDEIKEERKMERDMRFKRFEAEMAEKEEERDLKKRKVRMLETFPDRVAKAIDKAVSGGKAEAEGVLPVKVEGKDVLTVIKCPQCKGDIPVPRGHGGKVVCPNPDCAGIWKIEGTPEPGTEKK